jgi:hypothetical protein
VAALGLAAGWAGTASGGETRGIARGDVAAVEARIRQWQPTAAEKRFDEIGWARDIRDAVHLARRNGRPVFLFTHDGRMNLGRC